MPILKSGSRLRSIVCDTEVIVIRSPAGECDIRCGGEPMAPVQGPAGPRAAAATSGFDSGTKLGKRYTSAEENCEFLCTKGGGGTLSIGQTLLTEMRPKALPSSD